jgi:hypothetical protein
MDTQIQHLFCRARASQRRDESDSTVPFKLLKLMELASNAGGPRRSRCQWRPGRLGLRPVSSSAHWQAGLPAVPVGRYQFGGGQTPGPFDHSGPEPHASKLSWVRPPVTARRLRDRLSRPGPGPASQCSSFKLASVPQRQADSDTGTLAI